MSRTIDITGNRYGRLVVVQQMESRNRKSMWLCRCDCGNTIVVFGSALKCGTTKSCGCYKRENAQKLYSTCRSKNHKLYGIWNAIKQRCYNENSNSYKNYGGRGITMCEEWMHNFDAFYHWSIENGYGNGLEIDRIDVNGNYCPENCRWVDKIIQANNKRNNKKYEMNGELKTIAEWSREYGLDYYLVRQRVEKLGWTIKQALTVNICK